MPLVMRLETAAARMERSRAFGDIDAAELIATIREAARRIKVLESGLVPLGETFRGGAYDDPDVVKG